LSQPSLFFTECRVLEIDALDLLGDRTQEQLDLVEVVATHLAREFLLFDVHRRQAGTHRSSSSVRLNIIL
jgi:hypothetical protein